MNKQALGTPQSERWATSAGIHRHRSGSYPILALACWLAVVSVSFGYDTSTHEAMSRLALGRHPGCTVDVFLKTQLGLLGGVNERGLFQPVVGSPGVREMSLLEATGLGSIEEDGVLPLPGRILNHFYNPLTKGGLGEVVSGESSLDWAWDGRSLVPHENFSWNRARRRQFEWLALPQDWRSSRISMAETFRCLGHVIHLVQDLAQPQHTRNDAHTYPVPGGDGAPFEEYCATRFGTEATLTGNLPGWSAEPIPVFTRKPSLGDIGEKPPEFVAFWDTWQYTGGNDPQLGFPGQLGLAEFSNAYFVTDDTLFTGEPLDARASQVDGRVGIQVFRDRTCGRRYRFFDLGGYESFHLFPHPRLRSLANLCTLLAPFGTQYSEIEASRIRPNPPGTGYQQWQYAGVPAGRFGAPPIPNYCSVDVRPLEPGNSSVLRLYPALTEVNFKAHAEVLLPKAIAYSAGLLNYFFRGQLRADILILDCSTQPQATIEISNLSSWEGQGQTLQDGEFVILRDDGPGSTRVESARITRTTGYPGSLARGEKFIVNLPSLPRGLRNYVVFRGTIGNEKDIAVAAALGSVRKRSSVYPISPSLRTSITWISGGRVGNSVVATAQLRDANGFPLAEKEIRFSVSLNSRGGPAVANQLTDCAGNVTVSFSALLDNGQPAAGARVTAYFEAFDDPSYQPSHLRSSSY